MKKILTCMAVWTLLISLTACKTGNKYEIGKYDVITAEDGNNIAFNNLSDLENYADEEFSLPEEFSIMDETLKATAYNFIKTADYDAMQLTYNDKYVIRQGSGYLGNISGNTSDIISCPVINGENVTIYYDNELPVSAFIEINDKTYSFYCEDGFDDVSIIEDLILAIK